MSELKKKVRELKCGKVAPEGPGRSNKWPGVRAAFLKDHNECAVCEGKLKLEVHHKKPFHLHPELELDPTNFITLCEEKADGINCHLSFGHLGSFKSFNINVDDDAKMWNDKIKNRPKENLE